MGNWTDLATGRRRAAVLAAHFGAAMAPMREDRSWWPDSKKHSAWVLLRAREFGPASVVEDPVHRRWLLRALTEWRATRGGSIEPRRFSRLLTASGFVAGLHEAQGMQLAGFDPVAHADTLVGLFDALDGIKTSEAQLVAISKTLYHVLPELIVPFDGQVTCGFFGWTALPDRPHRGWLIDVYSLLGDVAAAVGADELERLGTPAWPQDPAVAGALRIGQARVVDFGMEGYQRSRGEAWYVA
jgi:hypothetical protein